MSAGQNLQPGLNSYELKRRQRLLWSWFCAFTQSVCSFLSQNSPSHILNVTVVDDTNITLAPARRESGRNQRSRAISCMNLLQTLIFRVNGSNGHSDGAYRTFLVHTPVMPLERADTKGLSREFISWLFVWLGSIGSRFLKFCGPHGHSEGAAGTTSRIPIQNLIICFDSLKTNLSVLKGLRQTVFKKKQGMESTGSDLKQIFPFLAVRCSLHQLALTRKLLIFFYRSHWSSVVRLAHLFETHNFREQFRKSLLRVLTNNFVFIPVANLPADFKSWQSKRAKIGIVNGDPCYSKTRLQTHRSLMGIDNSDPSADKIVHWCVGAGCPCGGSRKRAFITLCKLYCDLFCSGFQVPLTYRWLHASPALAFCKDTCAKFLLGYVFAFLCNDVDVLFTFGVQSFLACL